MTGRTSPAPAIATGRTARPLRWFFVLAYALSWLWLVPIALSGGTVIGGHGWPTHFPALAGPALAAVSVTAAYGGRRGLAGLGRRMLAVQVPVRWWSVALSPLLLLPVVLAVTAATGQPLPPLADFAVINGVPASWGVAGVALAVLLVNGFGEETGWRGYALPCAQARWSPLRSTLVVSVGWAGWHAPMFLVLQSFRGFTAVTVVGWFIGLLCGAVVLTWLYNRSGGSIALVAVWHAAYNMVSATKAAEGLLAATSTTLVITAAFFLIALELFAARRGTPSVLAPPAGTGRP
ncbi:CPBP family intramembrane glutamic endopeptidase [Microbispora sp. ZYX-F-249]|uniref:CPBP family intramembrane glutamic endopeptidase n=1 Tax=Microbispora maris TaxID=3144104 RepID=A0ABV0AFH1_9ACTN